MISLLPQPSPYQLLHIYYLKGQVHRPYDVHYRDSGEGVPTDFIGNWEEGGESFLFFHQPADNWVAHLLAEQPHLELMDRFQMTYEQWQGGQLTPFQVGRLHIIPAWYSQLGSPAAGCLRLDPGVVFGTGIHPTTRHCLEALQQVFDAHLISRVLDIGTGTGLLALAAAELGARQVIAVDLNQLAVETAQRNVLGNRLGRRILVVRGNAKNFMDLACDLMVSNIHYDVMRHLIETPGFRNQRHFILSGLLRSQARDIEARLHSLSAELVAQWQQDDVWFTLYGRNAG